MGYNEFSYGYDIAESMLAGVSGFLIVFMLLFYLLLLGWSILVYVLECMSLYTIAKRRGIHNPWLAWVPIGIGWILGSISDQYQYVAKGNVRNRRKVLMGFEIAMVVGPILALVMSFVMGVSIGMSVEMGGAETGAAMGASIAGLMLLEVAMVVVTLIYMVFWYIALYDLYASCEPSNAVLYVVLSVTINVTMPFFMFACRKKDLGMPPRRKVAVEQPVLPHTEVVAEQEPVDEAPVDETPAVEIPVDEVSVEETSAEGAEPVDE